MFYQVCLLNILFIQIYSRTLISLRATSVENCNILVKYQQKTTFYRSIYIFLIYTPDVLS